MKEREETEVYVIDNKKYIVKSRIIENAEKLDNLYIAFSRYAIEKLKEKT